MQQGILQLVMQKTLEEIDKLADARVHLFQLQVGFKMLKRIALSLYVAEYFAVGLIELDAHRTV